MKITDVFIQNNETKQQTQAKNTDFEKFLSEEPSKTNDDYYQIHQQQLEQSALTFHPLMTSSHKSNTIPESKAPLKQASTPIQEKLSLDSSPPREEFLSIKKFIITSKMDDFFQKPLFEKKETLSVLGDPKQFVKQPQIDKTRSNSRSVLAQQPSVVFKNHQVVVFNKQVELSINTATFSKQTSRDLQTRIKQWLVDNGYVLKQLTINGVIQ